jgi:hypothetical protein
LDDFGFLDAFLETMDQSFWLDDDLSEIVQDNTNDVFLVFPNESNLVLDNDFASFLDDSFWTQP